MTVCVSGISMEIKASVPLKFLEPFAASPDAPPDISVTVHRGIPALDLSPLYEEQGIAWYTLPDGRIAFGAEAGGAVAALTVTRPDWSDVSVYLAEGADEAFWLEKTVGDVIFRSAVIEHAGLVLHASAIKWEGRGLAFSAPKGTGKATHTDLWVKNEGAVIINGDRPLLTVRDGKILVSGTPWSGASPYRENVTLPLDMLILLERGKENYIRRLSTMEGLQWLVPRCSLPYHDKRAMETAMNTFGQILSGASMYLLTCNTEENSVRVVKKQLLDSVYSMSQMEI